MKEETKITDMTFYQIEKLVADLNYQIEDVTRDYQSALRMLNECREGSELRVLELLLVEKADSIAAWRNVAASLAEQLVIAQSKLMRHQIGISPHVDDVLNSYRNLCDLR